MAYLTNNLNFEIKGKIGEYSFRTYNGKTQIRMRPKEFNISYSDEAVANRNKFKVAGHFAKAALELKYLKEIWRAFNPEGHSAYNTVCKYNYHLVSPEAPTDKNIITPDGFELPVRELRYSENFIVIELAALYKSINLTKGETDLVINALAAGINPVDSVDSPYQILKLTKEEAGFDFTKAYSGSIKLDTEQKLILSKYRNSIVYLAVVLKDDSGEVGQSSATYASEV